MPLKLIHLEDDPLDRELVAKTLRAEGLDFAVIGVDSRKEFERALAEPPDIILSDYTMPGFGGDDAQDIALKHWPDVPFLFVSGSIGEEKAVERLKCGATDYVLKDRLNKLGTAVRRALREAEDRRQRAEAESQLRQLNAELEARVEERTHDLVSANHQLQQARRVAERANLAKSEFLSGMSHDLRTPLNAIMGFAQLLQLDRLTADQSDNVAYILRGGEHLLNLINEVLDIARIEAGRLTLSAEPVSVAEALEQAMALVRPMASQRLISLSIEAPPELCVLADRQRLTQILLNLLSNAVKYNREGGSVRVNAHPRQHEVRVEVADTGAGIPSQKLALLFTPFERLGAEQSGIEGTGLGLALSKRLAEEMKGTLTVDSIVDRGTTFHLTLPAAHAAATEGHVVAHAPMALADYAGTILYIEDNSSNVVLMQRLLTRRPRVVLKHAPDGHTALQMLKSERPNLVFLDLHLSDLPGEEVLRRIWEDTATRDIPVAILSADATRHSQRTLRASGAIAYLTKPFEIAEILHLIDEVVGGVGKPGGA